MDGFVDGQFDDPTEGAPEFTHTVSTPLDQIFDSREGGVFIDDPLLQWSEEEEDDNAKDNSSYDENEEDEVWDNVLTNVDDEDWEIAERDFTKQYNRLRQHVAVRTGSAENQVPRGAQLSGPPNRSVPLPAVNRGRTLSAPSAMSQHITDQLSALSKYAARIARIDQPYGQMGIATSRKDPSERANLKDKSDRATNEQVLDPRTRLILFKMIGRGLISEVNGVVSTGKEANVYHALSPEKKHIALKIFKTSILIFKDRDRYVTGERRFRRGYSKHNPRKMVRLWAEKEMRNLKRLVAAGIPCPEPIEVRENVLAMSFLGDTAGWASPRLKNAEIPEDQFTNLYKCLLLTVRKMFQECKLVHADLSEYNILYHQSRLFIIDVGQSVEQDHPSAFDFLRSDLKNVEEFFGKRGVATIGVRHSFEFVIGDLSESNEEVWLNRLMEQAQSGRKEGNDLDKLESEEKLDEKIFMRSYIPRTLNEVYNPERDVDLINQGRGQSLIYSDIIGVVGAAEGLKKIRISEPYEDEESMKAREIPYPNKLEEGVDDTTGEEVSEGEESDQEQSESEAFKERRLRGHRNEDKEFKKERKKATKEAAREKRKHKMPKAEKKRHIKATRS